VAPAAAMLRRQQKQQEQLSRQQQLKPRPLFNLPGPSYLSVLAAFSIFLSTESSVPHVKKLLVYRVIILRIFLYVDQQAGIIKSEIAE
jgi:hypothetical protein